MIQVCLGLMENIIYLCLGLMEICIHFSLGKMYIERDVDKILVNWKQSSKWKPLLLRGARQVGKTNSVRQLGKQFLYFLEVNFESDKQVHSVFEGDLSAEKIAEYLSVIYNIPVIKGETLLFFDEIQACLPAIQSLRFFYEQMPGLHVVAAGSLMEFALEEIPSFGVGRIRSVFMYPLSFNEFLNAFGEKKILNMKRKASPSNLLPDVIHQKLLDYLRRFLILGGMPEVVSRYVETGNILESRQIMDDLITTFYDDFAKYKKKVPSGRLKEVFNAVVMQAGKKFVYSKAQTVANQKQVKEALNLLIMAGIVIPVTHSAANGLPLGAEANPKRQKMLLLDTGLYLRILGLNIGNLILAKEFNSINKGGVAEMFTGLELLKYRSPFLRSELYYWHREAKNSNAEVDYIIAENAGIIPIEVKSGTKGSMQSLFLFLKEKNLNKGLRISTENFSAYGNIEVYPLYAVENITH